jgi:hypothetical protein
MARIENVSPREIEIPKLDKDGKPFSEKDPAYVLLGSINDRAAKAAKEEGVPDSEIEVSDKQLLAYRANPAFKAREDASELRVYV